MLVIVGGPCDIVAFDDCGVLGCLVDAFDDEDVVRRGRGLEAVEEGPLGNDRVVRGEDVPCVSSDERFDRGVDAGCDFDVSERTLSAVFATAVAI